MDYRGHLSWEDKTALFGAYLVDRGVQSSTLRSYFSAIKFILRQDGYIWNDKQFLLKSLTRGCKLENDRLKVRLPIQKGLFELLLFEINRYYNSNPQPYLEAMYQALFCLAYYGMLRVGELTFSPHCLKARNINVAGNKDKIQVVLYTSKTHDQASKPQKIYISGIEEELTKSGGISTRSDRIFCPIAIVLKFMHIRGHYEWDEDQFFIFADGSTVKPDHFRNFLRLLLGRLGLDAALYDVHSFRIERTCDLEKYGYSVDQIKAMGRWKSNAVYRYLKN